MPDQIIDDLATPVTLLQSIAQGDHSAFKELYDLFSVKVYNIVLNYTQHEQDAEEVTQEVFTSIFKHAGSFKGRAQVSTWIYRIAVNKSINHLNRKKRFSFLSLGFGTDETPDFVHPGVLLENKEKAKQLYKAIASLPENQKTAFILSFIEELPRQEVADTMEISLKATESLLQRAKKNLRKKLGDFYQKRRK